MGSIAITAISGSVDSQRQTATPNKPLKSHYHAFLDEETVAVAEDDTVQLSAEAQAQLDQMGDDLDVAA